MENVVVAGLEADRAQILKGIAVYSKDLGFCSARGFGAGKSDQHIACLGQWFSTLAMF